MLHLGVQPRSDETPRQYAEAVSRLASVRHALRLVEPFGAGPASDIPDDARIAAAWDGADETRQRLFDVRSEHMVGAAADGIEALLAERQEGREPHAAASQTLIEEIRRELREVAGVVLG
jgi:hypothetical protein